MQSFRNFVRGPVGIVLLVLFTVPFVITGFYGYFEGGGRSTDVVAEVEGRPLSGSMLNQRVQLLRQQVISQSPEVDPALLESFITPAMVLQGLINNELLMVEAQEASLLVSESQAARVLASNPQFQDETGQFSAQRFERAVRAQGMTQKSYLRAVRQEMTMNQVRAGLQDTDFALPGELEDQRRLAEQQRDLRFVRKTVSSLAQAVDVSADEVEAWYANNRDSFMTPEKVRLEYLEISPEQFSAEITVTDEQVEAEYAARRAAMEQVAARTERRQAAHILVAVNEERSEPEAVQRLSTLQDRLAAGEDFASLAREFSDDAASASAGGDLGAVGRGDLPEAMEQALFALGEGEVSAPVRTDSGLHLVRLLGVQQRDLPALEDSRDQIVNDLRRRLAETRAMELADQLESLAFEHSDLQTPSETLGLPLRTSGWLALGENEGLLRFEPVREALASSMVREQRLNSDLLSLPDGRVVVVRLAERQEAAPMPLEQVRNRIRATLQRERALAELDRLAEESRAAVATGEGLDAVASALGESVSEQSGVNRMSAQPPAEVVRAAFRVSRDDRAPHILRLANGDLVAFAVTAVRDGGSELSEADQTRALAELASVEGERSLRQSLLWLRETSDVQVYESRLAPVTEE